MAGLYLLRGGELFVARNKQHYDAIIECNNIEDDADGWVEPEGAITHTFLEGGQLTFIIAFNNRYFEASTSDEVRELAVHEAVHVVQHVRKRMLEGCMTAVDTLLATGGLGAEFEAYAIQNTYANILEAFEKARDAYT